MCCDDAKNYKTRLEYLLHYNEEDTIIMCPIIDKLISCYKPYGVDMLHQISLSSNASQLKYAMAYKHFDMNADYSEVVKTTYTLSERAWERKCVSYLEQDRKRVQKTYRDPRFIKVNPNYTTINEYLCTVQYLS
jgi:hypothetical protein